MGEPVGLVRIQNKNKIKDAISEGLNQIDFKLEKEVKTVAIKVNLCFYWSASTGCTTDPLVVAGIIDVIRERYGQDVDIKVVEADATAMRTKHAFQMLGYTKLAKEKNVQLVNLVEGEQEEKTVHVNGQKISFTVPKLLMEADLFINVPKIKIMREVTITCAFKNLFGAMGARRKAAYHKHLNETIVGVNEVLKPHLVIVDGLVGLGKHPVKLDLIMASTDPFSIDWTAAQLMGYNPSKIEFLKIAIKEKVGHPDGIEIRGESIEPFQKIFPKTNSFKQKLFFGIQLNVLKLYNRIVKDSIPNELDGA
jgi:uncharacterized protein (DUF362 family)